MTEDRVDSLLKVQNSILETLQIYGQLYDRQQQLLRKLQEDVTRVHHLIHKLYVIHYPPKPARQLVPKMNAEEIVDSLRGILNSSCSCTMTTDDKVKIRHLLHIIERNILFNSLVDELRNGSYSDSTHA